MKRKKAGIALHPETQQLLEFIRKQRKESRVFGIPVGKAMAGGVGERGRMGDLQKG